MLDKRTTELVGRPLQLHLEPVEGQPVRRESTYQTSTRVPEQLRPRRRIRHQQLRLAAPDSPGADRPVAGPRSKRPRGCSRVERLGRRRARERLAAQRGDQLRDCPTRTSVSSAAGSGQISTGDPNTTGSDAIASRRTTIPTRGTSAAPALTNPGAGQYGNAPRTNGSARYQFRKNIDLVLAKDTTVSARTRARSASRSSTSPTRRSSTGIDRTPSTRRVSDDLVTGRVHADLAADVPLSF